MKIAGYVKNSLIDYPAHISCAVFLGGCNFDCWYCHNRSYIKGQGDIESETVLEFLKRRKGLIQGVVVSGGEPTLNAELPDFLNKIKEMGYLVKLDTNGSRPKVVKDIISQGLVDYIAMDYKAPLEKYPEIVHVNVNINDIKESIDTILASNIDYEFRTTFVPTLIDADIVKIAKEISSSKKYCLQQYRHEDEYSKILGKEVRPHTPEYIRQTAQKLKDFFNGELIIRGL